MTTFILTLLFLLIIVAAMSIGVLLGKKPISGSCGGMSAIGMDTVCDICGGDPNRCDETDETQQVAKPEPEGLAYDASRTR